jgi:xanthine dehydrogenase small subunit
VTRNTVRFLRRGKIVELSEFAPRVTLLDYLRLIEKSRGTKEGCGEGDCGACTVALGSLRNGTIAYEPVNACIVLLGQVDGKEIVTVDDLANGGKLHPTQQALVEHHGSQCGFCTPGFVMSLFALYHEDGKPTRQDILDQLAGNLCRCTGYRSIVTAAGQACTGQANDKWSESKSDIVGNLSKIAGSEDVFIGDETSFFAAPASVESLATLAADHPDAVILAGATDVGLWITKQLRELPKIIHIARVKELHRVDDTEDMLTLGSAMTYAEAEPRLSAIDPDLGELLRRLGSKQVRAMGTVGGNIANGSPIGDTPPALIALGASIELRKGSAVRRMALEDFFIAYGKQDREPGEVLIRISIPKLKSNEAFRCYKIAKRFDQDISAVLAAFKFALAGRRISEARVAFGGMAATPKRARATEAKLKQLALDNRNQWPATAAALAQDFTPIDDHRATARYRMETAQALLLKALTEISGEDSSKTRLVGFRETHPHAA